MLLDLTLSLSYSSLAKRRKDTYRKRSAYCIITLQSLRPGEDGKGRDLVFRIDGELC